MHLGSSPAARRRRGDRRPAWLHDRTRRAHARRGHGHEPAPRLLPRRPAEPQGSARADGLLMRRSIIRTGRSEEHTYELQSLMRISYAAFCFKKKITI